MKLFKTTTVTLIILIAILWILMFAWVYFPLNSILTTPVEREQTEALLNEANISVSKELLKQSVHSLKGADITYLAENKEDLASKILGDNVFQESENSFVCDENKMFFSDNTILIEGKDDSITKINKDNAEIKAKKLLEKLKLAKYESVSNIYEKSDGILVVFVPIFDKLTIYDAKIKVLLSPDSSFKIEAIPIEISKSKEKLLPCSAYSAISEIALMDTANGIRVSGMKLGYKLSDSKLISVWEITTDDGNVYYVS